MHLTRRNVKSRNERKRRERKRDIDTVNYDGVQHATRYTLLALRQSLNIYYHSYAPVYDEKQASCCFRRDRSLRYFSKTHHCKYISNFFFAVRAFPRAIYRTFVVKSNPSIGRQFLEMRMLEKWYSVRERWYKCVIHDDLTHEEARRKYLPKCICIKLVFLSGISLAAAQVQVKSEGKSVTIKVDHPRTSMSSDKESVAWKRASATMDLS